MTETAPDARRGMELGTIEILLVDDNERWVTFMAEELERHDSTLDVGTASSANEALSALGETDADCVVLDYQMPEIDGIQLLNRIRADRPDLPCILVTGEGSEDVAARAIDAGVTDYLRKNPRVDQVSVLAGKIKSVVERQALRRAIADGERRYRTVTEQSRDAIVILQSARIAFGNEQLGRLTGERLEDLIGGDFIDRVVHDADEHRFGEVVFGSADEPLAEGIHDVRLIGADGTVRHCEYTGRAITYDGEAATMLSIRDVTEKRERETRLRRERRLNTRIQRALVTAESRADLEATIATELTESGYDLAWIGTIGDTRLRPRAVAGDADYLETIDLRIDRETTESEPAVWAARTGTLQPIGDLEELFPTDWRDAALDAGFRAAITLPIAYGEIIYGVLAVYSGRAGRTGDDERALLSDLAATVGYAIHHLEARKALTADRGVDARIELPDRAHYLHEIVADLEGGHPGLELVVHSTCPRDDAVSQYVSVEAGAGEAFRTGAEAHPAVRELVPVRTADRALFHLTVEDATPETVLEPYNALVRSTRITADRTVVRIGLPSKTNLRSLVGALGDRYGRATVLSCTEADLTRLRSRPSLQSSDLTEKQAAALEAAYRHGYFDQPRGSSASEIAETLGIAHSTYLQHLRAAERKVFETLYDG